MLRSNLFILGVCFVITFSIAAPVHKEDKKPFRADIALPEAEEDGPASEEVTTKEPEKTEKKQKNKSKEIRDSGRNSDDFLNYAGPLTNEELGVFADEINITPAPSTEAPPTIKKHKKHHRRHHKKKHTTTTTTPAPSVESESESESVSEEEVQKPNKNASDFVDLAGPLNDQDLGVFAKEINGATKSKRSPKKHPERNAQDFLDMAGPLPGFDGNQGDMKTLKFQNSN